MKYIALTYLLLLAFYNGFSQSTISGDYVFEPECEVKCTPVKNQSKSGTCWSFATISFLESELLKSGKGEYDLSEMFMVREAYPLKVDNYVRLQGSVDIRTGGQAHDVMNMIKKYGILPESAYSGIIPPATIHDHEELDEMIKTMAPAISKFRKKDLNRGMDALNGVLDVYLGKLPEKFSYNGKDYTAMSFRDFLGLNPDNYIELTSYNAYPYHEYIDLQVPDNWSHGRYLNVPLDELVSVTDLALKKGYSVCWDGDVSDRGFSGSKGIAELENETDLNVTEESRQKAFDNFSATDDHLMHIVGIVHNQYGQKFYKVKNSWGNIGKYNGFCYMSEKYFRLNTTAICINKAALPEKLTR